MPRMTAIQESAFHLINIIVCNDSEKESPLIGSIIDPKSITITSLQDRAEVAKYVGLVAASCMFSMLYMVNISSYPGREAYFSERTSLAIENLGRLSALVCLVIAILNYHKHQACWDNIRTIKQL